MITKEYASGQIIFKQGDYSDCMYDILSGKVGVYSAYGTQEEKLVAELGANTRTPAGWSTRRQRRRSRVGKRATSSCRTSITTWIFIRTRCFCE